VEAVQNEWSLLQRDLENEIQSFCGQNSISIMSYSSIAKGILTGAFHFGGAKLKEDDFRAPRRLFNAQHLEYEKELLEEMKTIADRKNILLSQLAIAWLLHKDALTSAIVGTQSEKHLVENLESLTIKLTPSEIEILNTVSAKALAKIDANGLDLLTPGKR
jgi:aryl-alcohol dehydrogenase-like predicted oxidoreductase